MNKSEINILLSSKEYRLKRRYWIESLSLVQSKTVLKQYGMTQRGEVGEEYDRVVKVCGNEIDELLMKISNGNPMSIYIMFLTAINILLHRYLGEKQIVLMTPIHKECNKDLCFNEFLPVVSMIQGNASFKGLLFEIKKTVVEAYQNQTYPLENVLNQLNEEESILTNWTNVVCSMEKLHMKYSLECDFNFHINEQNGQYQIELQYKKGACDVDYVKQILEHTCIILYKCLSNPDVEVGQIEFLNDKELFFWKKSYNLNYLSLEKTIIDLFEQQVRETPEKLAICDAEKAFTYNELNKKINQLAHFLLQEDIRKGDVVGIIMDNSIEVVVSMLAILKTGAMYLPINKDFPQQRIQYMLENAYVKNVITDGTNYYKGCRVYNIYEEQLWSDMPKENLNVAISLEDCAYMIFTSGSTGNPKGTVIRHRGLCNYITWAKKSYVNETIESFPLYSSISFDLTVTSIYTPLISGGKIVVYAGADKVALVKNIIEDNQVDIIKLTPAHLLILEELDCSKCKIKGIIVGGDNLTAELVARIIKKFNHHIDIYNEYGPTEATVGCMIHKYNEGTDRRGSVPIGVPIENTRIYLFDQYGKLVPYGVCGELYIAGFGVAKGYFNNEEATNNSFLKDSTYDFGTMYRTGDYAFMHKNGEIEFLGREDNQIKIKGYRIGLGEIENALLLFPKVRSCVVRLFRNSHNQDELSAFLALEEHVKAQEFREYLTNSLPDYMIPIRFYRVDTIPINQNGKVELTELTNQIVDLEEKKAYVAPSNSLEKLLVSIYEEILGIHPISVNDDFFQLGGDSIKAIRVAANLYKSNYQIGIEDIFSYPQISLLCQKLKKTENVEDECLGQVLLSPIQKYFFDLGLQNPNCFCQSMVLYAENHFDEQYIKESFIEISKIHDCFRLRYRKEAEQIIQFYSDDNNLFYYETAEILEEQLEEKVAEIGSRLQAQINIVNGPLMACSLQKTEKGDHLFIVIHHLIIDGVSWRILLEDMDEIYTKKVKAKPIEYSHKTSSYQAWVRWVKEYANHDARQYELDYWNQNLKVVEPLFERKDTCAKEYDQIVFELTKEQTAAILKQIHVVYGTDINSFLICAFSLALKQVCEKNNISFLFEGHGREKVGEMLNISRTIGWFTAIYPVILDLSKISSVEDAIVLVKNALRKIPNKGFDYSVLKYCRDNMPEENEFYKKDFEILFNYLGDISDEVIKNNFKQSKFHIKHSMCDVEKNLYAMELNGVTVNERMQFKAKYIKETFIDSTLPGKIMDCFKEKLIELLNHCLLMCKTHSDIDIIEKSLVTLNEMNLIESMLGSIDLE